MRRINNNAGLATIDIVWAKTLMITPLSDIIIISSSRSTAFIAATLPFLETG